MRQLVRSPRVENRRERVSPAASEAPPDDGVIGWHRACGYGSISQFAAKMVERWSARRSRGTGLIVLEERSGERGGRGVRFA
jgi:hypothetical protein